MQFVQYVNRSQKHFLWCFEGQSNDSNKSNLGDRYFCWCYSVNAIDRKEGTETSNCLSSLKEGICMHILWINDFEAITVYPRWFIM